MLLILNQCKEKAHQFVMRSMILVSQYLTNEKAGLLPAVNPAGKILFSYSMYIIEEETFFFKISKTKPCKIFISFIFSAKVTV